MTETDGMTWGTMTGKLLPPPERGAGTYEIHDTGGVRSARQFDDAGNDITPQALAEAIDQRDRARRVAVALEQEGAAREEQFREMAAADSPRCPSCDHTAAHHQAPGCYWLSSVGETGADLMCPCTLHFVEALSPTDDEDVKRDG